MNNHYKNAPPFVLLLTGPAGAGKTTVARAWASRQSRPTAHISLDDVRDFVKAGYANPSDGFNAETERQLVLARQGCAFLARQYTQAGFLCIIDDAIFPAWEVAGYQKWQELLADMPHYFIVLLPAFEYILERNQHRAGQRLLSGAMLRTIYEMMLPWREQAKFPLIDNSEMSVEQAVARLEVEIRDWIAPS